MTATVGHRLAAPPPTPEPRRRPGGRRGRAFREELRAPAAAGGAMRRTSSRNLPAGQNGSDPVGRLCPGELPQLRGAHDDRG
ncbi:hypothetical protein [Herbiconiux daphne]|uniref:Uncharacterized protein n=1 Tax=Herbiconiux daphne TaxID=2970914 RepID=A0ABT2H5M0_9MICO|nr:hypothetical protein [Herbiconiux daphne]MCS5735240.1 hypothetical protein [Herbiconiux daphne]